MNAPPVQYVTTRDGYSIAYGSRGAGMPLVIAPWPIGHLQFIWEQPSERLLLLQELSRRFQLVLYDARGQGLSTRGLPEDLTVEAFVQDMEAVVQRLGIGRFVLYGWGNALGHVAVHFAARHPELVAGLVLQCSAVSTKAWPSALFSELPSQNWSYYLDQVARAHAQAYAQVAPEDVAKLDHEVLVSQLHQSMNQRDWASIVRAFLRDDASSLLKGLEMPALILHQRDFRPLPTAEASKLAGTIPNARLVLLEGSTQLGDSARTADAIDDFVRTLDISQAGVTSGSAGGAPGGLSAREIEVLRLLAGGKSNQKIADELVISLNTVNRHVSNIYAKTGAANRAEAASYATRNGLAG